MRPLPTRSVLLLSLALATLLLAFGPSCTSSATKDVERQPQPPFPGSRASLFRPLFTDLDAPMLGAWGTSASDFFLVGGAADRSRVIAFRDGRYWQIDPGTKNALWWTFGFSRDDVFAVGEKGTIVHFDGRAFSPMANPAGADATLWGIWGSKRDDLWAVGGSPTVSGPKALVLRYDGQAFTRITIPGAPAVDFFKVWGSGRGEVFIVGAAGTIYRWENGTFTRQASGTTETLLTVTGRSATDVYAVGGGAKGVIVHYDGTAWTRIDKDDRQRLINGVSTAPGRDTVVVGLNGSIATERGGEFVEQPDPPITRDTLHVVWGDGRSIMLAAGGNLSAQGEPPRGTVLAAGPLPTGTISPWPFSPVAVDAGTVSDAGASSDAAAPDAGEPADASAPDVGSPDAGSPDVGSPDTGSTDVGARDVGTADVGAPDVGTPDVGAPDVGAAIPDGGCATGGLRDPDAGTCPRQNSPCTSNLDCPTGVTCWQIFGGTTRCLKDCVDVSECGPEYGANACCNVPGPQAFQKVCQPSGGLFCNPADAGP